MRSVFQFFQGYAPKDGPKYITINLALDVLVQSLEINLTDETANNSIEWLQSAFIDNTENSEPLTITLGISAQRLVIPAGAQGTFPLIATNPPVLNFSSPVAGPVSVGVILMNMPTPYAVWFAAGSGGGGGGAEFFAGSDWIDFSDTTAGGGVDGIAIPANTARKRILVINNDAAETLYLNFGAPATNTGDSIAIYPNGGQYSSPPTGNESPQDIHLMSVTGTVQFTAKEM